MNYQSRTVSVSVLACLVIGLFAASTLECARAQTLWTGTNSLSATTNWSDTANWSTGIVPTSSTAVLFGDGNTVATAAVVDNVVDGNVTISSLTYTNSNTQFHTTLIPSGNTLTVNGNVTVGGQNVNGVSTRADITGSGATFKAGTGSSTLTVDDTSSGGTASTGILNLSGLDNFIFNAGGAGGGVNMGNTARSQGQLTLAAVSNNLTVTTFNLGNNNTGGTSSLTLGPGTNIINVNTLQAGFGKCTGNILFGGATGGLRMRNAAGTGRASLTLGFRSNSGGSSSSCNGTMNLLGHPVDILAGTISLGQRTSTGGGTGIMRGTLAFDNGVVDVTTVNMGIGQADTTGAVGTLAVGGTGLLKVNDISLVNTLNATVGAASGTLAITNGGTVNCAGNILKTSTNGTGNITLADSGKLTLGAGHAIGSIFLPIDNMSLSDSTLTLSPGTSATNVMVVNLTTGGAGNTIQLGFLPSITSYPVTFRLIKYQGSIAGSGFNFALTGLSGAYTGSLSNNTANSSVDLVISAGPVPKAIKWSGSPNGNWDTSTLNWKAGATSTNYNQGDLAIFDDTALGTTTVNLAADLVPGSLTVNNTALSYTFTGSGRLTGLAGLAKQGSGTLLLDNTGANDFGGSITISGGTLQVGSGSTTGSLGSGSISNGASLVFNRSDDLTVANVISGPASGTLTKNGAGTLTLSAANTFTGAVTVAQGTLKVANASALGQTNAGTTISSGASLDFNAINIGLEPVTVSGAGVGGNGALINNGGQVLPAVARVTLAGNTTFGGTGRWDLRSATTGDPSQSSLLTGGQPYSLIKTGANQVSIVGTTVDAALGDVDIQAGLLSLEVATTGLGNPSANLIVRAGASLQLFQLTNRLNKIITLNGISTTNTVINNSGDNTVIGPTTLNGDCVFSVGGTSLTLSNTIGGSGNLIKSGANTLILAGGPDGYTGSTTVSNGTLFVNCTVNGGGTLTTYTNSTLGGTGNHTGPVVVGGALAPGTSAGTLTTGPLTLNSGASCNFELNSVNTVGGGVNDLVQVNGGLTLNNNALSISFLGAGLQNGSYRLFNYTGSLVGTLNPTVTVGGGVSRYTLTPDYSTAQQVNLNVSGSTASLRWDSTSSTEWDIATSANWFNLGSSTPGDLFYQADSVLFDDTAGLQTAIDIASGISVAPAGLTVTSDNNSYSITGAGRIVGGTSLVKNGASTLTLGTTNLFSGGLAVNGGTVRLVTNNAAGSGLITVKGGTTLVVGGIHTNSITLTNSTLGVVNADFTTAATSELTVLGPTGSTIQSSDPQNAATSRNIQVDGTLRGSGNIFVKNADNITSPDGNQGVRFRGTAVSDYSGTITVDNNSKCEMRVSGAGPFSPVGTGKFILTCGSYNGGNAVTCSGSGGYLEFNLRNNNTAGNGDTYLGTDFELTGSGAVVLNMLSDGTGAPAGAIATFGNLKMGDSQELIGYRGSGNLHVARFQSVTLTGGNITFSPKSQTFGAANQVGADFILSNITETAASSLTMAGLRTLTLSGTNKYTGDTTVSAGTLALLGNTALTNSPNIVLGPGAVLDVSGRTDGTLALRAGQTLSGNGTIRGILIANAATTVSPGASVGALAVTNTVTLLGTNIMEIDKTGFTNDVLRSSVGITYGGRLVLSTLNLPYGAGDSFKLFDAPAYSGKFTALDPVSPGAGLAWNTNDLVTTGTLKVVATGPVSKPKIADFTYNGPDVSVSGTNGPAYSQYQLLSSTNVALPINTWTAIRTNYFDAAGNFGEFGIPVDPNDPQRFYFIRIQLP